MGHRWTIADIPTQSGRTFVVTGANSGLGFEAAKALAGRGAHVVLACRRPATAEEAIDRIREAHPEASLEAQELDLADLASVRKASDALHDRHPALDGLINNAGVMALPHRTTADGFEMQLGTNHLGHFALTGLLLDRLLATNGSRVVSVSSIMHVPGRIDFDDLQGERRYGKWKAYSQSKLANLLFTHELARRLGAAGVATIAAAAHPGYSSTNLQITGPRMAGSTFMERWSHLTNVVMAQPAAMGALPLLYAATAPGVVNDGYYGPQGAFGLHGHPGPAWRTPASSDDAVAQRLWEVSEELTGVRYPLPAA